MRKAKGENSQKKVSNESSAKLVKGTLSATEINLINSKDQK